jgi:glycosyltransferase involved in cell wall biosynthesis
VKIALLIDYPVDPTRIAGGVRAVAYHLCQGLARHADLDLHVIHCHSEAPATQVVQHGRVTVHYLTRPRRRIVPNLITGVGAVTEALRALQPDLVNAHTPQYGFAALRAGLPTLYTIHGVPHRELHTFRHWKQRLELSISAFYDRQVIRRVGDIIAISPYILSEYQGRTPARFHRVDNPIPDDYFNLAAPEVAGRILFAGTISERKDPLTLLVALERVRRDAPAAHVRFAGRAIDPDYPRRVERFVAEHGLRQAAQFLGLLDVGALMAEYASCALLALPSRQETAPVVILEAMAAGKPVVATDVGGARDLIEEGASGFIVPPAEPAPLAERIERLLGDDALRAAVGRRGKEIAWARFRRDVVADRYYAIYREVAGRLGLAWRDAGAPA